MVHIAKKLQEKHRDGKATFSFEYFVPKTAQVCPLLRCVLTVTQPLTNNDRRVSKTSMTVRLELHSTLINSSLTINRHGPHACPRAPIHRHNLERGRPSL